MTITPFPAAAGNPCWWTRKDFSYLIFSLLQQSSGIDGKTHPGEASCPCGPLDPVWGHDLFVGGAQKVTKKCISRYVIQPSPAVSCFPPGKTEN